MKFRFAKESSLLLLSMALATPAGTQSQSSKQSELVIRATTRMVSVDAVVTDKDGHPVTNLTKDDFTVLEDGKTQTISSFAVSDPVMRVQQTPKAQPVLPPHVTTNRPDVVEASDHIAVLLLDGLNTPPQNQNYLKQQMLKFLAEHFDPSRKLAVVVLSEKLTVLQDFTSDPALLQAALKRFQAVSPAVARNNGEWDLSQNYVSTPEISLPPQANGGPDSSGSDPTQVPTSGGSSDTIANDIAYMMRRFENEAQNFARDTRVNITLDALDQIARFLSGQRGRKSLLWFSTAFPIAVSGINPEDMATSRTYGDKLRATTNLLNDAHVAIYAIDAAGLVGGSIGDASQSGRDATGRIMLTVEANRKLAKDEFARMASDDTLERAALDTGGRFFHANDISNSISLSLDESGSYYMLSYYPTNKKWDGKFRQLKVKVNRSGLTVRSRQGYFAIDAARNREENKTADLKAAVSAISLPSTQVTFMARAIPPAKNAKNTDLMVEFAVDSNTVSFETVASTSGSGTPVARQNCNLSFEVQVFTQDGKFVKGAGQSAKADLEPETYERVRTQGIPIKVPISLNAGKYVLHLGVRDNHTGLIGTAQLPVVIGGS